MEPDDSLPYSKKSATSLFSEPDESSPLPPTLFKRQLNIILLFNVSLSVHLSIILAIDQLNAQILFL